MLFVKHWFMHRDPQKRPKTWEMLQPCVEDSFIKHTDRVKCSETSFNKNQ